MLLIAWGQISRCKADKDSIEGTYTMQRSVTNALENIYDQPTYGMRLLEQGPEVSLPLMKTLVEFLPALGASIGLYIHN